MTTLRQILFVPPAPVVWATHVGAFGPDGLTVDSTRTLSSDQIGQGLADGAWDVGIGVMDNVLGWNQAHRAGLRILAQLERSQPMAFCGRPGCGSLADAAAGTIGVDATTNGFVLVLYRALARAGIARDACRFEAVGGVLQRYEALTGGRIDATILVPPFIDRAVEAGCTVLWRGTDIAPDYPGVVATARGAWIDANRPVAEAYVRALRQGNAWGAAPDRRPDAVAALRAAGYGESASLHLAAQAMPDLAPSAAGWRETVALREEAGLLEADAPTFEAICDRESLRWSRDAIAR